MSWSEGYVADINYTFGYYAEMNPVRLNLALLLAGLEGLPDGPCCELGFGQGVSVNVHAAGNIGRQWWGTDFNPAQVAYARQLASAAGSQAILDEQSFADFCARDDLPPFALIALHGVWSWISDDNRHQIVELARRRLLPGGVLYVSYNTPPGWSPMQPLRHLLVEHARSMSAPGCQTPDKMAAAIQFSEQLLAVEPLFAKANPALLQRVKTLGGQHPAYLAHEYMNADWVPMPFADVARWLTPAKLNYAGSAQPLDYLDALHMTDAQRELMTGIEDREFRETVRELILNQQFRRDVWVKGARRLPKREQMQRFWQLPLVLVAASVPEELKVQTARGEVGLQSRYYHPVLALLAAQDEPLTVGELARQLQSAGPYDAALLMQIVTTLVGMGLVMPAQSVAATDAARPYTARLNAHFWREALHSQDVVYNVSPVTGGGVTIGHVPQLLLAARAEGHVSPDAWVAFARQRLMSEGRGLSKAGQSLQDATQVDAELREQAARFVQLLPVLQRLQIV